MIKNVSSNHRCFQFFSCVLTRNMSEFIDKEAHCDDDVSEDEKSQAPNSEDEAFIDDGKEDEVLVPETPSLYRRVDNDRERAFSPPVRPALPPNYIEESKKAQDEVLISLQELARELNGGVSPVYD